MGERVKVKFTKNYIATVGAGIAGQKDSYKVFPMTDQLEALIKDGTLELCGATPAATRETAVVTPPEVTGKAGVKKKSKSSE
jgi:hypothetical protein